MEDLKDIRTESSYHEDHGGDAFSHQVHQSEDTSGSGSLWENLEKGLEKDLVSSEFSAGADSSEVSEEFTAQSPSEFDVPEGFSHEAYPSAEEERYNGPSSEFESGASGDFVAPSSFHAEPPKDAAFDEATRPVYSSADSGEDKTVSIQQDFNAMSSVGATSAGTDADRTIAVEGFANARVGARKAPDVDVKVSIGSFRGGGRGAANVMTSVDASLVQAESLRLAQHRILELEKENEHLRAENEELASAGEIIRSRADDLTVRISSLEKEKEEIQESAQSEILILKGNLQYKENEVAKARIKIDELETRLKSDFKKIRVRERELENRLELLRAEKSALVRSKDEYILEQKRKIDQLSQELDNYRKKCLELNKTIEANQDQVKRTERALRLALTNLEAKEENLVPLKKAE